MNDTSSSRNSEARSLGELVQARVSYHRQQQDAAYRAGDLAGVAAHFKAAHNWLSVAGRQS